MALFKTVATEHFKVLFLIFVLGNGFHAVPVNPNPANSCSPGFYTGLLITHYLLVFQILLAACFLLGIRMVLIRAEASAVAVARAVNGRAFDAAAAAAQGIAFFPVRERLALRLMLLIGLMQSCCASFLAIDAFKDGFLYRTGCNDGYSAGLPSEYTLIILMLSVHSFSAWVGMCRN